MSVNKVNSSTGDLEPIAGATYYSDIPIGSITPFGGSVIPSSFLLCNGQSLLRTDYPELFAVIGTSFGSVDSTHFNIPDLRGEFLRGAGTNSHSGEGNGGSVGTHQGATRIPNIYLSGGSALLVTPDQNSLWGNADSEYGSSTGYKGAGVARQGDSVIPLNYSTRPTNTSVNFIIKATTIALPSDFEDAVDEKIAGLIKSKAISNSTDVNGNLAFGLGADVVVIGFIANTTSFDGVYTMFYSSAAQGWYIHVSNWDGTRITGGAVVGTVYYLIK